MKTAVELKALVQAKFGGRFENVDDIELRPMLEALLENEFTITPTFSDNEQGDTTGDLTLTVTDGNGDALTEAVEIDVTLSATAGGVAADLGEVAAQAGTIIAEFVTDAVIRVRTTAAGVATLTLTNATVTDEWFYRAQVVGAPPSGAAEGSETVTTA